jgi:hypothetical protein
LPGLGKLGTGTCPTVTPADIGLLRNCDSLQ